MWSDVFQAEKGWGDFDDNDYVKDNNNKPQQGQGKKLGGYLISNMTMRMTTRTQQGLGLGKCDGSMGEDELQKGHGQHLWGGGFVQLVIQTCTSKWVNVDKPRL